LLLQAAGLNINNGFFRKLRIDFLAANNEFTRRVAVGVEQIVIGLRLMASSPYFQGYTRE
jgi:hypothetical protein